MNMNQNEMSFLWIMCPVSEAVSSKRLRKYHIRQMSDLALSFSNLKGLLVGENLKAFWEEAMEIRKARRYQSGMLADLLEAARKLRVQDPEVGANFLNCVNSLVARSGRGKNCPRT